VIDWFCVELTMIFVALVFAPAASQRLRLNLAIGTIRTLRSHISIHHHHCHACYLYICMLNYNLCSINDVGGQRSERHKW
jgi:hypothetical protein